MGMDAQAFQFNAADPLAWRERVMQSKAPEGEQLAAVSAEFEAILLRQYLSEALKPISKEGDVFGGGNSIYQSMINDALASGLSKSGTFGFSNLMQAQLSSSLRHDHDDHTDTL